MSRPDLIAAQQVYLQDIENDIKTQNDFINAKYAVIKRAQEQETQASGDIHVAQEQIEALTIQSTQVQETIAILETIDETFI